MTNLIRQFQFPMMPSDIFHDFERFFNGLNVYDPQTQNLKMKGFPKGDIYLDSAGNRVIELALAGYSKEQLSVVVENDSIVVSATKCDGTDESRSLARRAFRQQFSNIGEQTFDLEKADVKYKDGLLKIVIPKKESKEVKQIEIK